MFQFSGKSLFHSIIKDVMTNHDKKSYKWLHTFENLSYIMYICRFTYILLCLYQPTDYSLIQIDFFSHLIENLSTDKDYFFCVTFIMMFISCVALETCLYFSRTDTCTWGIIEDQVMRTDQIFKECLLPQDEQKTILQIRFEEIKKQKIHLDLVPELLLNLYCKLIAKIVFWAKGDAFDLVRMKTFTWKYQPAAKIQLRVKMYRILSIQEKINCLAIIFVCKCQVVCIKMFCF